MQDLRENTTRLDLIKNGESGSDAKFPQLWRQAIETIAQTHAKYWGGHEITHQNFKCVDYFNGHNQEIWKENLETTKRAWNLADKSEMSDKLVKIIDKTLENATFEKAIDHLKSRPLTLTHGDFHSKNIFLTKDQNMIFFDFQELGLGDPFSDLV